MAEDFATGTTGCCALSMQELCARLDLFKVRELLCCDQRAESRFIDRVLTENLRDVVVVLQASGAELHRQQIMNFDHAAHTTSELHVERAIHAIIAKLPVA